MKKIIVGLGNPGGKYKYSRHNTGFLLVDELVAQLGIKKWKESVKFGAKFVIDSINDVGYIKPQTFMNHSGQSVVKFAEYYGVDPKKLIIIHDDLDLPMFTVKKQFEAGSAGHNGVEDIIEKLGTKDFWRIRIGIGRPENSKIDTSDWVLSSFSQRDLDQLKLLADKVKELIAD